MDLKQPERYFRSYIFVPCCSEDHPCIHNQLHGYQAISSSYPSTVSKCDAMLGTQSEHQATYTSRFTPHTADYSLFFPATQTERYQQPCEVSRHDISVESLPEKPIIRDFRERRSWKMETGCKRKRNRTIFTTDQLERLENEFDRQQYIVGTQRFYLAADLGLNETQVKVWFQNRRIKWRRQNLSNMGNSNCSRSDKDDVENVKF